MTGSEQQVPSRTSALIASGLVVACCVAALGSVFTASSVQHRSWQAATALWQHDYTTALRLADHVLQEDPGCHFALVIAGDAASALHEHDRAIAYYRQVSDDDELLAVRAQLGLGSRFLLAGRMKEAEQHFRYVLDRDPDQFDANKHLAFLMQIQGRTWESVDPVLRLIRRGIFGATEIHIAGCPENRLVIDPRYLKRCAIAAPDDPRSILAAGRLAALRNDSDAAKEIFHRVIAADDGLLEAHFRLGRILLDEECDDEFLALMSSLPPTAEIHAGFWINRALWAARTGDTKGAARCLAEVLKRTPGNVEANYMLSQLLVKLAQPIAARQFGERAKILAKTELTIPEFYDEPTAERMQSLIRDLESLQRYWEAAAVCQFACDREEESPPWALKRLAVISEKLRRTGETLVPPAPLDEWPEIAAYPLPGWSRAAADRRESDVASGPSSAVITFRDVAAETGLEFTHFNGSLSVRGMEHIFETTGGGVSAIDFDGDLWPDLYLTQGAPIWSGDDQVRHIDRLFRNTGSAFQDVTLAAGLGDDRFSQGANVGDFDNDGFADMYLGNLGENRFYRNNGDGTFSEITADTNTGGDEWTVSCLLADLNGDSLQDLYVVNYLNRESVFERRCRKNDQPLTCAPTLFPAEQDRVYLNAGDGSYREVTQECGVVQTEGKGLAIAAGDFDQSGRLSVFVGNDTTPNFFLRNRTASDKQLRFEEAGIVSGLAVDGLGRSQATMGVACGDVDGTGSVDLFITNFYEDANTLYLQHAATTFVDSSRDAGLYEPSVPMLGFGTEFVDADLDGHLDLFVTNGHVDRTVATGEPDEMPPQFFRNFGRGRFALQDGPVPGDYFKKKYLGRTVSRLDWNRDGLDDLCVLHLYTPVALLTNTTDAHGRFLTVRLRGTTVDRDAFGTTLQFTTEDQTFTHQLTVGDGYMTCNERRLTAGLGNASLVKQLSVRWPGGKQQEFEEIDVNQEILIIEGFPRPFRLPR
jgi:tetratricopeptide (TPR) repeat protein